MAFNIILSHIFPENFFPSALTIFINFSDFLIFSASDVTYNRWCQHFFNLHLFSIGCLTVELIYIDIRLVLLKYEKGVGIKCWVLVEDGSFISLFLHRKFPFSFLKSNLLIFEIFAVFSNCKNKVDNKKSINNNSN